MHLLKKRRATALILAILAILGIAGARLWYQQRKPFVIMAQPGDIKTVPQERGGMYIPKNMTIHDDLVGHKKVNRPPESKEKVVLGIFPGERAAQKAILRFISLAPDVFQKQAPIVEKKDDQAYAVVAHLAPHDQHSVCKLIEEQGGNCSIEEDIST